MKGLLFKSWKSQAIAASPTTQTWQTRRVIKQAIWKSPKDGTIEVAGDVLPARERGYIAWYPGGGEGLAEFTKREYKEGFMPHYHAGETVYIKEAHYAYGYWTARGLTKSGNPKWTFQQCHDFGVWFEDNKPASIVVKKGHGDLGWYKRSTMFMFEKDARTFVRIDQVEAKMARNITPKECQMEGIVKERQKGTCCYAWPSGELLYLTPESAYFALYDSINGPGAHEKNWSWVYTFHRVDKPLNE